MLFKTDILKRPLLLLNSGKVINLNTLEEAAPIELKPVRAEVKLSISKHRNESFLTKAQRYFSVSKISKDYGISWYQLESNLFVYCVIKGDELQLVGNYPVHYLKLLYRFISHS